MNTRINSISSSTSSAPVGVSSISESIEMAEIPNTSWQPERPILTPPSSIDYSLLEVTEESRELGNQIVRTFADRLSGVKNKIREISTENIQKLKENAKRASDSSWWGVLKKLAQFLLAAISIVFGLAFGPTLIGGLMITSGILSLVNFALSETKAWDWIAAQLSGENEEWKRRLITFLPMAVGLAAAGFGMAGSIYGLASGAIQLGEKVLYIAQTAISLFDAGTTFGKGQADARLLWSQAELKGIQANMTIERTHVDTLTKLIEGSLAEFRAAGSKAKKITQAMMQTNTQLARQV